MNACNARNILCLGKKNLEPDNFSINSINMVDLLFFVGFNKSVSGLFILKNKKTYICNYLCILLGDKYLYICALYCSQ